MSAFTDWLADKSARRVVLVELVESSGTHYLSDNGYTTGPSEAPSNTYYEARIIGDLVIERALSGLFSLRSGVYNGGDITVANHDGALDDWYRKTWQSATIKYGDPSWSLSQFETRWTGRIESVEVTDLEIRFLLVDRYDDLREPAQKVPHWFGQILGQLRPLSYGYPKNITPPLTGTSNPDYYIHEANTCEDPVVSRYVNQKPSTSPSVVTESGAVFELASMPNGALTCDTKGVRNSGGTWLTAPGECLEHLLTRSVDVLFGYAEGGSTNTIILDRNASDADDAYNGLTIKCVSATDPAPPWASPAVGHTISDYDGATHTVTISDTWEADVATRGEGDLYLIELSSESNRVGPFESVDTAAFNAYDTALGSPQVGMWIAEEQTFAHVLDAVVSPGGFHAITPAGLPTIGILTEPSSAAADLSLGEGDTHGQIEIATLQPPIYRMAVGYDRNYSPAGAGDSHDTLDTERAIFVANAYRYTKKEDQDILASDPHARDLTFDTVYTEVADALSELDRYWDLFSVARNVYVVRGFTEPMGVDLGGVIKITDSRYGMSSGKNLVLITILENLTHGTCELELWGGTEGDVFESGGTYELADAYEDGDIDAFMDGDISAYEN